MSDSIPGPHISLSLTSGSVSAGQTLNARARTSLRDPGPGPSQSILGQKRPLKGMRAHEFAEDGKSRRVGKVRITRRTILQIADAICSKLTRYLSSSWAMSIRRKGQQRLQRLRKGFRKYVC